MSRGKYIFLSVLLLIFYAAGLPMFIIGITGEDQVLFVVIGLLACGLPTGIIFWIISTLFDGVGRESRLARRLFFFLIGLVLGLVVTPIMIIWCIVKAAKGGSPKPQAPVEEKPVEEIPTDIPRP